MHYGPGLNRSGTRNALRTQTQDRDISKQMGFVSKKRGDRGVLSRRERARSYRLTCQIPPAKRASKRKTTR